VPIQPTTEFAATSPEVIRAIIQDIQGSDRRRRVFEAVYSGGNKPKNAAELSAKTRLSEMAVLQLATPMANKQYFEQLKHEGRVAFKKYPHINAVKLTILRSSKDGKRPQREPERKAEGKMAPRRPARARGIRSAWGSSPISVRRGPTHDVFVCHASEDKGFVDPLVKALNKAGVRVWYDKDALVWGDGLRSSIDRGLVNSRYGIVVFSKAFLKRKHWTEHELDGLFAKERNGRKVILPIWHGITDRELDKYSPAFADRIAMITKKDSVSDIVKNLKVLLKKS
jgi:TIR domain